MTQAIQDPFAVKYSRPEGSKVPTGRHIHGRLIAAIPVGAEPVKLVPNDKGEPGAMQKRLIADVIVCDGGPIWYGGDINTPGSDNIQMQAPCVIPEMWLFGEALIEWIMDASMRGVALGRIVKKATKNQTRSYWIMDVPTPGDRQLALPLYHQYQAGTLFTEANLPANAAAQPVITTAPAFMGGVAAPVNPSAPAWPAPAAPAMPAWPAAPVAPPVDWTLDQMPQNFPGSAEQWQGATQEMRAGFLAQLGITGPVKPTGL